MPKKRYKPEEIVAKLLQADGHLSQGIRVADAIRQIRRQRGHLPPVALTLGSAWKQVSDYIPHMSDKERPMRSQTPQAPHSSLPRRSSTALAIGHAPLDVFDRTV